MVNRKNRKSNRDVELTYYDPLDLTSHSHGPERTTEDLRIGNAQLIFALLRGRIPIISQTQAFDSRVVLGAAAEGSVHAPSFRWLVQSGYVRIPLFKQPSLQEAFVAALQNSNFVFLCWPEIGGPKANIDRKAIVSMLRTRKRSSELPDAVAARVETIIALNEAVSKSRFTYFAKPARNSLSQVLAKMYKATVNRHSEVGDILKGLVDLKSDSWGVHFSQLQKSTVPAKTVAIELLDLAYTSVVAESVGARQSNFRGSQEALNIMNDVVSDGHRYDVFDTNCLAPGSLPLKQVGWEETAEFLRQTSDLPATDKERLALTSQLLVRVAKEHGGWFTFIPKGLNALYSGLLWAGVPAVVMYETRQTAGLFVTGFIPAALGEVWSWRAKLEKLLLGRLERRYSAILQNHAISNME